MKVESLPIENLPIDYDLLTYNLITSAATTVQALKLLEGSAGFLISEVLRLAKSAEFEGVKLKALQILLNKILPDITESRLQIDVRSPYERILEEVEKEVQSGDKIALPHKQTPENIGKPLSTESIELPILIQKCSK